MGHQPVDWDSNHDRLILYADIMGFKAKLVNTPHNKLVAELRDFVKKLCAHLSPYHTGGHLRMTLFSDLVVVAADRANLPNYQLLVGAAATLMNECFRMNYPINGCISLGSLAFDAPQIVADAETTKILQGRGGQYMPLFVGQAVVDSYLLSENLFCYGIVLHPNVEKLHNLALRDTNTKYHLPFYKIPIPIKTGGVARLYYFKWADTKRATKNPTFEQLDSQLTNMENTTGVRPRAYIYNTRNVLKKLYSKNNRKYNQCLKSV